MSFKAFYDNTLRTRRQRNEPLLVEGVTGWVRARGLGDSDQDDLGRTLSDDAPDSRRRRFPFGERLAKPSLFFFRNRNQEPSRCLRVEKEIHQVSIERAL